VSYYQSLPRFHFEKKGIPYFPASGSAVVFFRFTFVFRLSSTLVFRAPDAGLKPGATITLASRHCIMLVPCGDMETPPGSTLTGINVKVKLEIFIRKIKTCPWLVATGGDPGAPARSRLPQGNYTRRQESIHMSF